MIQKLRAALDADDRAVSPVIGVILMVAITVILAAVIASLTLGLGDSAQTAPTAKFDFEQSDNPSSGVDVVVSHESGASINSDQISIQTTDSDSATWTGTGDSEVSAGDYATLTGISDSDNEIKVIWTSEDGGTSTTLATYTVQ